MLTVITDLKRIAQLNRALGSKLRERLPYFETRVITSPGGKYDFKVLFEKGGGEDVSGWASGSLQGDKLRNFIVFGKPGADKLLNVAVQINFPVHKFSTALAGVFLEDEAGKIFLGHRGKLTGSGGAFKALQVLDRLSKCVVAMEKGKNVPLALVGDIEGAEFVDDIFSFARDCRDVVIQLGIERDFQKAQPIGKFVVGPEDNGSTLSLSDSHRLLRLKAYFDEFAGETTRRAISSGVRTVRHGAVVSALEQSLRANGRTQKSIAVDLVVVAGDHVSVYEVKTSNSTTDVYTGLGQLCIHGDAILEIFQLPVRRYLVMPERPKPSHEASMVKRFDINIIIYNKISDRFRFSQ